MALLAINTSVYHSKTYMYCSIDLPVQIRDMRYHCQREGSNPHSHGYCSEVAIKSTGPPLITLYSLS